MAALGHSHIFLGLPLDRDVGVDELENLLAEEDLKALKVEERKRKYRTIRREPMQPK
jgi:hypothetical protein